MKCHSDFIVMQINLNQRFGSYLFFINILDKSKMRIPRKMKNKVWFRENVVKISLPYTAAVENNLKLNLKLQAFR